MPFKQRGGNCGLTLSRIAAIGLGGLVLVTVVVGVLFSRSLYAQAREDVNAANNPLTPTLTFNVHNQWASELYDVDPGSNALLLRGVIPHKLGGRGQLFRYTLPTVTAPDGSGGTVTGLGDLNIFDLFPFLVKRARLELAVGPQLTIPTATNDLTGTGKWQGGFAMIAAAPRSFGIAGALVTWQHSFAGDDDRDTQHNLGVQPLFIYNLPQGWYLRSSATWNFAFAEDAWSIPIGAGAGKVWLRPGGASINAFAEPQFTVAHDGAGQPKFQVFMGLNLQFPLARK
jgi:hypothetical protein